MRCTNCKKEVIEGSEFCSHCGSKINNEDNMTNRKNTNGEENSKSKRKFYGLILAIIIVILIILGSIYIVTTNKKGSNNDNSSQNEYIQQNSITKEEIENLFIRNLSDEEWVKENLFIKKDYFGDDVTVYTKQNVSIAKANDYVRIAVIEYEQPFTRNCKVLTYKDGNIQINDLQNSRDGYILDTEKNILYQYFQDMGSIGYNIYLVTENGVEKICYISAHYTGLTDEGDMILEDFKKDDVSITESEFDNIKKQYINENLSEDEIFESINHLFEDEDILDTNINEDTLLRVVSDTMEYYKLRWHIGEVIEDKSTVTYINTWRNRYIFKMDLTYYPAEIGNNSSFYTDTTQMRQMQIYVLYDNEIGDFKIYQSYTDVQNDLYS